MKVHLQEVLDKNCSMAAFSKNVRAEYKAGKRAKGTQHVAIAMSVLKRACGVDDDVKGSPKEIVQKGGGKVETVSRFIPLDFITELKGTDTRAARRDFVLWLVALRKTAEAASSETLSTSRFVSGKRTQKLQKFLKTAVKQPFPPPGDVKTRIVRKQEELGDGPGRFADLFERISGMGSFGIDMMTTPMGIHGVGTSPSASTIPERSRYNVQHTAQGIVSGRRRKRGRLGIKLLPAGQGTRF